MIDSDLDKKSYPQDAKDGKTIHMEYHQLVDLKNNQEIDRNIQIFTLIQHALKPDQLFLGTSHGFYILSINKAALPNICFNTNYTSIFTINQVRLPGDSKRARTQLLNSPAPLRTCGCVGVCW